MRWCGGPEVGAAWICHHAAWMEAKRHLQAHVAAARDEVVPAAATDKAVPPSVGGNAVSQYVVPVFSDSARGSLPQSPCAGIAPIHGRRSCLRGGGARPHDRIYP